MMMMMMMMMINEVHLNARQKIPVSYRLNADVGNGWNKLSISIRFYYHRKEQPCMHSIRNNTIKQLTF